MTASMKATSVCRPRTIETTASVLFIVTAASIFAWLLTVSQAAQMLSGAILTIIEGLRAVWGTVSRIIQAFRE